MCFHCQDHISFGEVTRFMRMKLEASLLLKSRCSLRARCMYKLFSYYLYVYSAPILSYLQSTEV
jgi:hypothetical protein